MFKNAISRVALVPVALMATATTAFAQETDPAAAGLEGLVTKAQGYVGYIIPLVIVGVGFLLFKKYSNRAT